MQKPLRRPTPHPVTSEDAEEDAEAARTHAMMPEGPVAVPQGAASLEWQRFLLDQSQQAEQLKLSQAELKLKQDQFNQQKIEWQEASTPSARTSRFLIVAVPLLVAAVTASCGFIDSQKKEAQAAALTAQTEQFKAILETKRDIFKKQDVVFASVVATTSDIARRVKELEKARQKARQGDNKNGANLADDPTYARLEARFEGLYYGDMATVENDDICDAMIMFKHGLAFAEQPSQGNYKTINAEFQEQYHVYRQSQPSASYDLSDDPAEMLDDLQVFLSYVLGDTINRRTDPSQYQFLKPTA